MSEFEFLFGLFGLLLGFTIIEVLKGLVETIKCSGPLHSRGEQPVRLGWLTPLLGLFVLIDATSTWVNLWELRSYLNVGFDSAFAILLIASVYYFAASMVFPPNPEEWPDLDLWFWKHRRKVLVSIGFCSLVSMLFAASRSNDPSGVLVPLAVYLALLAGAAILRNRWVVGGSLVLISAVYLAMAIGTALSRL